MDGPGRRLAWGLLVAVGLGVLVGCSAGWQERDGACVRELRGEQVQRVINYADPELCGRMVKERRRDYVRVPPPEK